MNTTNEGTTTRAQTEQERQFVAMATAMVNALRNANLNGNQRQRREIKPPDFKGNDARQWLRDYIRRAQQNQWEDEEMVRSAYSNFDFKTRRWYNHTFNGDAPTCEEFEDAFRERCEISGGADYIWRELYQVSQEDNETSLEFYDRVAELCNKRTHV